MDDLPNQLGAQCSNTQSNWEIERKKERKTERKKLEGGFPLHYNRTLGLEPKGVTQRGGGKGVTNSELYYVIY